MRSNAIALIILMAITVQSASSSLIDLGSHPESSDLSTKMMEAKIADALRGIGSATSAAGLSPGLDVNESFNNSSSYNQSINASSLNSTALNGSTIETRPGAAMISEGAFASPQELGTTTKGTSNGFWGIQASRHVMGQSDIRSNLFLTGNFDVDKTVSFSDRGS
jgi:hypothetical protein